MYEAEGVLERNNASLSDHESEHSVSFESEIDFKESHWSISKK